MNVKILNDTQIGIECFLYYETQPSHLVLKPGESHSISREATKLVLEKEDIWSTKSYLNLFLLLLYSLDLIFGNMMDAVNMPFSIKYVLSLSMYEKKTILVSDILKTKEKAIKLWKKVCSIQIALICFLVLVIGVAFAFAFSNWYSMIIISLFVGAGVVTFSKLVCRRNCVEKELMKYTEKTD